MQVELHSGWNEAGLADSLGHDRVGVDNSPSHDPYLFAIADTMRY